MKTSESISKCLECGFIDLSKNFSVLVGTASYAHLCPHCRAGESSILHALTDYLLTTIPADPQSTRYMMINNIYGHFAVADCNSGTRLSTWGSHARAVEDFRATQLNVRRLCGEFAMSRQSIEATENRTGERRRIPSAESDQRQFNVLCASEPRLGRDRRAAGP